MNDAARFWEKVEKTDTCWLWRSSLNNKGYGQFHVGSFSQHVLAHRFSWALAHGEVPTGSIVMHTCDMPACVRPDHLRIGTQGDNQRDMAAKGRAGHLGVRSPNAKLDDQKVREIRALHAIGTSIAELARRYGVERVVVRGVVRRRRWKHVE